MAFILDADCLSLSRLLVLSGSDTEPWSPSLAVTVKSGMGSSRLAKAPAVYSSICHSSAGPRVGGLNEQGSGDAVCVDGRGRADWRQRNLPTATLDTVGVSWRA
jgi:hypothetical protein